MTDIDRQIKLEMQSLELGKERYWKRVEREGLPAVAAGKRLIRMVVEPTIGAIDAWKEKAGGGGAGRKHTAYKYLRHIPSDQLALLAATELFNGLIQQRALTSAAAHIGRAVKEHVERLTLIAKEPKLVKFLDRKLAKVSSERHRRAVLTMTHRVQGVEMEWPVRDLVHVGTLLVDLIAQSSGVIKIVVGASKKKGTTAYIQLTEEARTLLGRMHARCELLEPLHLPMIVKPKPWTAPTNGGYYTARFPVIKTYHRNYVEDLRGVDLSGVYGALNALQSTAWKVNAAVFNVLREAWDSNTLLGGLPQQEQHELPAKPADIATNEAAKKEWKKKAAAVYEDNARLISKRLAVSRQVWMAGKFVEEAELYFPHAIDWRGRAYPVVSDLSPQANDVGRALLHFAHGKPLGENGAYWLAVHIANLFGVDKVPFDERVAWVQENSGKLLDSAMNPLDGERFWCQADSPWQALAACLEWMGYTMQGDSYVSNLPIAMDGSCNGLQNFSAMLRDKVGGTATNLVPAERPQDIYQRVADVVTAKLEASSEPLAAMWLAVGVDRKLVKRPVMTLPYGATKFGMREQVFLTVREGGYDVPEDGRFEACAFLANMVYDAIGEVVIAARAAMDWLQEVAKVASKDNLPVRWTAPSGLPVVQAYRKVNRNGVAKVVLSGRKVELSLNIEEKGIDSRRQALGIAPNFVHSMDASHMMRTVELGVRHGIEEFAMIHDSYGTLAADVDTLNHLLRVAFVEQYDGDVLARFRDELAAQLPGDLATELPPLPPKGDLELSTVLSSDYFFA